MSARTWFIVSCLALVGLLAIGGLALAAPAASTRATLSTGGQLYDKWWTAAGIAEPSGDQPLWATQSTNARKGLDTWRCKECHGWDYKGKDGAYGSGNHLTGFPGLISASSSKTQDQIAAILKGSTNPQHNFGAVLDDAAINALAYFVKDTARQDLTPYVDFATKKPKAADTAHGKQLYESTCTSCHGADGTAIRFGSAAAPEYIGTIANNPQEFLHKVRFGQPGSTMPTGVQMGWSIQDIVDVLAHAQTLPTTVVAAGAGSAGAATASAPAAAASPAASLAPAAGPLTGLPRTGGLPIDMLASMGAIFLGLGLGARRLLRRR